MPTLDEPPRRRAWRPGLRSAVEAAVIVAAVAGYAYLRGRGEFPRPIVRALRHGTAAERAEALRHLSQFGRAGEDAIPALLDALRDEHNPAIRRGAAHVLAAIATAPEPGEAFSLDLFLAGSGDPRFDRSADGRPPPAPHPRAEDVAAGLTRALRDDPDPTVRRQAILALADILNAATGTRPPRSLASRSMESEEQPAPAAPRAARPWMTAAARAVAGCAGADDPADRGAAMTWAYANPAAAILLGDAGRFDALLAGARAALRAGQPAPADRLIVKALAVEARHAPGRSEAVLRLLAEAMARSHAGGAAVRPEDLAVPFWLAGPSAAQLRAHPEVLDATARLLRRTPLWSPYDAGSHDPVLSASFIRYQSATREEGVFHLADRLVLRSLQQDRTTLDLVGERLDEAGWRTLLAAYGTWDDLVRGLLDPASRPALDPGRAAAVAETLFTVEAAIPGAEPDRRRRALVVLAYFVRGTAPGGAPRARLARRAAAVRDEPDAATRALADQLLPAVPQSP